MFTNAVPLLLRQTANDSPQQPIKGYALSLAFALTNLSILPYRFGSRQQNSICRAGTLSSFHALRGMHYLQLQLQIIVNIQYVTFMGMMLRTVVSEAESATGSGQLYAGGLCTYQRRVLFYLQLNYIRLLCNKHNITTPVPVAGAD